MSVVVVFVLVLCSAVNVHGDAESSFSGIAIEIILEKLDQLQNTINDMQTEMKEKDRKLSEAINQQSQKLVVLHAQVKQDRVSISNKMSGVVRAINEQNQTFAQILFEQRDFLKSMKNQGKSMEQKPIAVVHSMYDNFPVKQPHSKIVGQTVNAAHDVQESQTILSENGGVLFMTISDVSVQNNSFSSCRKILSNKSGKYVIQPTGNGAPFLALCEQTAFGGGWLVFQKRYDGSEEFFRNWADYRNGFGNIDKEFWLGLERLHQLTTARPHELAVELKDFDGNYTYARYDFFEIGSEMEQYALKKLGKYNGTAVDVLVYHKGRKFSTPDRDNDEWSSGNCAEGWKGAWWYGYCANTNLNGPYSLNSDAQSMYWNIYKPHAYTIMMIREK